MKTFKNFRKDIFEAKSEMNEDSLGDSFQKIVNDEKISQEELEVIWNSIPTQYKLAMKKETQNQDMPKIRQIARIMSMASERRDDKVYKKLHSQFENLVKKAKTSKDKYEDTKQFVGKS